MQRTTALTMSYGYSSGEYAPLIDGGGTRPLVGHVDPGRHELQQAAVAAPRRAVLVQRRRHPHGGGDRRRRSIGYTFWAPSGSASARVDLGRTWALSSNYSHGTTALSGLTREAYNSGAFSTSLGGSVGRVVLVFTGGLARGATGVGAVESSDYISYTGAAQASVPIGGAPERPRRIQLVQLRGERQRRRCHRRCRRTSSGAPSARASRWACRSSRVAERSPERHQCCLDASTRPIQILEHPLQGTLDRRRHGLRRDLRWPVRGAHDGRHLHRRSDGAGAAAARPGRLRAADRDVDRRGAAEDHRRGDPQPDAARAGDHRIQPLPREPRRRDGRRRRRDQRRADRRGRVGRARSPAGPRPDHRVQGRLRVSRARGRDEGDAAADRPC